MPETACPDFVQADGANRGYRAGRNRMVNTVEHFTVGRYPGDYSIGMRGYFQFYVPREMAPVQFAEVDAVCWHAGSWNQDGPGIEFERLSWDEPLTDHQIKWGGHVNRWLHNEWGIPLDFYDGPRIDRWSGFINHGSLLGRGERQDHTDGLTRAEWDLMIGDDMTPEQDARLGRIEAILAGDHSGGKFGYPDENSINDRVARLYATVVGGDVFGTTVASLEDRIVARLSGVSGSGSGVSLDQVKDAVRYELDQTRLAPR